MLHSYTPASGAAGKTSNSDFFHRKFQLICMFIINVEFAVLGFRKHSLLLSNNMAEYLADFHKSCKISEQDFSLSETWLQY